MTYWDSELFILPLFLYSLNKDLQLAIWCKCSEISIQLCVGFSLIGLWRLGIQYLLCIVLLELVEHIKNWKSVINSNICYFFQVSEEYKLASDTLYLTVNLIDRFMSHNYIEKQRLQLLGVTCMLIASWVTTLVSNYISTILLSKHSHCNKYKNCSISGYRGTHICSHCMLAALKCILDYKLN